jgi:seryl-tRNA synthetase
MHDIRAIRENASHFDKSLKRRGLTPLSKDVLALDKERREKINLAEEARAQQNMLAKKIGAAKAKK